MNKDVFKEGGSNPTTPPPAIFRISFKSEGKEVERKRKRNKMGGGGLIVNIFLGVEIFSFEVVIFSRGLKNYFFFGGGGLRNFPGGVKKFFGEGLRKIWGGGYVVKNFCGVEKIQGVEKFSGGGEVEKFWGVGMD